MIIALAGYNGFVGSGIQKYFNNHQFILISRDDLYGSPALLSEKITGCDVVMNFAGYPISRRWTAKRKKLIKNSRITTTRNLVEAVHLLKRKPKIFINASAIGIYNVDEEHTEKSTSYGNGFMAGIVNKWEEEVKKLDENIPAVIVRLGIVLGNDGGAFTRLKKLFQLGLGGIIAGGKQVYSFIHIDDVLQAMDFLIQNKSHGIYNFTAPKPVSNKIFTKILAKYSGKPALLPVPGFVLRIGMGEASEIITKGQTVYPKRLLDEGYKFTFATLEDAIVNLLNSGESH